jgi:16S rRNA (adenine1518-N6/adenine1519-N6)-dimethyltransferase
MKTKLGQNFLHDKNIANKIIREFLPQPGPVLEIGAGPGILSEMLLKNIPANLITLVEIDRFLAQKLKERFGDQLQIIENNILDIDLAKLYPQGQHKSSADFGGSDLSVPQGQVGIIGNLPYHISKELIDWFIAQRAKISSAVLMLQKDFVDKLLSPAGNKKYNAQSVVFQLLFRARRCFNVSAGSFTPAPKITSTVLAVHPVESPLQAAADEFYNFVKLCFAGRRKTLWNNLAAHIEKELLASMFATCGLEPCVRAEQLSAKLFHDLFNVKPRQ